MRKIMYYLLPIVLIILIFQIFYTDNKRARMFGGTMEVKVEPGQKIMMATFKGDNLFYMTEPMDSGYIPKVKILKEKSSHGIIETTIKFIETK